MLSDQGDGYLPRVCFFCKPFLDVPVTAETLAFLLLLLTACFDVFFFEADSPARSTIAEPCSL